MGLNIPMRVLTRLYGSIQMYQHGEPADNEAGIPEKRQT
jgi:hypothetical protein